MLAVAVEQVLVERHKGDESLLLREAWVPKDLNQKEIEARLSLRQLRAILSLEAAEQTLWRHRRHCASRTLDLQDLLQPDEVRVPAVARNLLLRPLNHSADVSEAPRLLWSVPDWLIVRHNFADWPRRSCGLAASLHLEVQSHLGCLRLLVLLWLQIGLGAVLERHLLLILALRLDYSLQVVLLNLFISLGLQRLEFGFWLWLNFVSDNIFVVFTHCLQLVLDVEVIGLGLARLIFDLVKLPVLIFLVVW